MRIQRAAWPAAGLVAGVAGIAVSHALTMGLTLRPNPLVSAGQFVAGHLPHWVDDTVVKLMGNRDSGAPEVSGAEVLEPWLVVILTLSFLGLSALSGVLARRGWWHPLVLQVVVGVLAVLAMIGRYTASALTVVPAVAGIVVWIVVLSFVAAPLQRPAVLDPVAEQSHPTAARFRRRDFVARAVVLGAGGVWLWLYGGRFGQKRRRVDETRRLLNLPIRAQAPHPEWRIGVEGVQPWRTPNDEFFIKHTALVPPAVELSEWRLRIHGLVDNEIELTYQDLIERKLKHQWVTLVSVTNKVGGDEVGNAWWSGVPIAELLAEAGVQAGADAVLQTSVDGWTCVTPLPALTDSRQALLAVGMNGEPLPIDHGYPVRTIVPGLFGHVSACKWVISLEVTSFAEADGYWTDHGFAPLGPVKIASRIDVPNPDTEVSAGPVDIAGSAWASLNGVVAVDVAVDGGPWLPARLAQAPGPQTWLQWAVTVDLAAGTHTARVRATATDGDQQTGVVADIRPDGATGWHEVEFDVT